MSEPAPEPRPSTPLLARASSAVRERAPGLTLILIVAAAAKFLEFRYGGPVMLYALLLGMALNFLSDEERARPGIATANKLVLRIGVALIGFQITFAQMMHLGLPVLAFIAGLVTAGIALGALAGRALKLDGPASALSAGAVSICGASAALALAAVLPKREGLDRDAAVTVVGVTALSTAAMIFYPIITHALGLSDTRAGVFVGASIHDVAQVVGAGYMISDTAGDAATIVKLERVLFLLPAALIIGLIFSARASGAGEKRFAVIPPWFLIAFFAFASLRSLDVAPQAVVDTAGPAARWCLVVAIAAVGVSTKLGEAMKVSGRLLAAIAVQTVIIFGLALAGAALLPLGS